MLDLSQIENTKHDQEKGHWWTIVHPLTGSHTGMRVKIAGPDSDIQKRARHRMVDALQELSSKRTKTSSPEARDKVMTDFLASIIVDWEVTEAGNPVKLEHGNIVRLINAARWIREQIDNYAGSYQPWYGAFAKAIVDEKPAAEGAD